MPITVSLLDSVLLGVELWSQGGLTASLLLPPTPSLFLFPSLSLSQLHFLALAVPFHVSFLACVFALAPLLGLPPVYLAVYRSDFTSVLVLLCLVQHSSVV